MLWLGVDVQPTFVLAFAWWSSASDVSLWDVNTWLEVVYGICDV